LAANSKERLMSALSSQLAARAGESSKPFQLHVLSLGRAVSSNENAQRGRRERGNGRTGTSQPFSLATRRLKQGCRKAFQTNG
jgi:hypothetical protein